MKKHLFLNSLLVIFTGLLQASVIPVNLTCENLKNPLVVDVPNPRLSWVNLSLDDERGELQTAWEIRAASTQDLLLSGKADLWNSGKVISGESVNNLYGGPPLPSRKDCWWQVRVWDRKGKKSEWSKPAFWSMGLLKKEEWTAQWIGAPWQGEELLSKPQSPGGGGKAGNRWPGSENTPPPAPLLRKTFTVNK
jgi:alpha-L-rhamnosidase